MELKRKADKEGEKYKDFYEKGIDFERYLKVKMKEI